MSEVFEVIPIPVVEVTLQSANPVIEVSIDKTGPAGSGTVDTTARSEITSHLVDSIDPHGTTLRQTVLLAVKATVAVVDGGSISTSQTVDFTNGGCYKCTATGSITFTVSSLGAGQRGSLHILSGSPKPIVSWVGVDVWLGGLPVFEANKLTVVTLFNDGTRIVASSGKSI